MSGIGSKHRTDTEPGSLTQRKILMSQNNYTESIKAPPGVHPSKPGTTDLNRQLVFIFWLVAAFMGALHAWETRHVMNADGISYLDIGDAYMRGDWKVAINANWSPLYSWLLGLTMVILAPSPYYEFTVVHIINFLIYLCTLGSFHFLLTQLLQYNRFRQNRELDDRTVTFAEWALIALGYSIFIRASLTMVTISSVSPDMSIAAFLYLAIGTLLRIRRGEVNYRIFSILGLILGFGFLAKAVMFPLAFIFIALSLFSGGSLRKTLPGAVVAFIVFLLIAAPFIAAISNAKGRFTYGESGKYNYWWHVNADHIYHWNGSPPGTGTPVHPSRKILDSPAIYEFGTPVGGTYPYWYDISYWTDGIQIKFDVNMQLKIIKRNLIAYYDTFFPFYTIPFYFSLLLYIMGRRRWLVFKDIAAQWIMFIPVITAFGMYCLIQIDDRYTGPFIPLLWLGVFSSIRLPNSEESKRLLKYASIILVILMMLMTGRTLQKENSSTPHVQWQVAEVLNEMGVTPGDKVASIGLSHSHFWARLARVQIITEMPHSEAARFWEADTSVKSRVIETFRSTGAKAIITNIMPEGEFHTGWQRMANSDYYVYILQK